MSRPKKQADLKQTIQTELANMLASDSEPSEGRMKLIKLGIGFLAVQAKLEESEYGDFFTDPADTGHPAEPRTKPATGRRTRGNGHAEDDGLGGLGADHGGADTGFADLGES